MGRLANKVAIITGAASGMGETTARVFAREGAKVIITDVQEQAIKDLVADIQGEYGDVALGIVHDIADEQSWVKVTQEVVAKFGKIDILVNNAAIGGKDWKYEDASLEEWQKVMKVNAEGAFLGICAVVPYMKKNDISSIVNINTLGVHVAGEGIAGISYSASKGAVDALTRAMASRLGKYNIRVNSVSPGPILTPMAKQYSSDEKLAEIASFNPLGRMGDPLDVAHTTLFLASDEVKFITGAEILVDGGFKIHKPL